jgi:hypothetical protein
MEEVMNYGRYKYLSNFAKKIFDHFNGIINIVIPAKLEISPISTECTIGCYAETIFPNIVIMYISEIDTVGNNDDITAKKVLLITECIIHELYHVDQVIDSTRCVCYNNPAYVNKYSMDIEGSVEFMTYTYIANNAIYISELINNIMMVNVITPEMVYEYAGIAKNGLNNFYKCDNFPMYNRTSCYDHFLITIVNLMGNTCLSKEIIKALTTCFEKGVPVTYIINGYEIPITWIDESTEELMMIDVDQYNNLLYESAFKYKFREFYIKDVNAEFELDGTFCFTFVSEQFNHMINIIE